MICVGSEYWNKLKSFMVEEMEKRGTIAPGDMDLFHIRDSHDEIIEIAKTARVRVVVPITGLAE